jgi:hypothetical protein
MKRSLYLTYLDWSLTVDGVASNDFDVLTVVPPPTRLFSPVSLIPRMSLSLDLSLGDFEGVLKKRKATRLTEPCAFHF